MSIIKQTSLTKLKDIKFGNDLPGGGDSGEPYITQPISNNKDFIGGELARASANDFIRIGRFFKDKPKGPLFISKQVGLQLSNPKLETSSIGFGNILGSTRLYNLGINTLAQIPVAGLGIHVVRHGLSPVVFEDQTYGKIVLNNDSPGTEGRNNRLVKLIYKLKADSNADISKYISGPNSVFGIGSTTIKRYSNVLNNNEYVSSDYLKPRPSVIDYYNLQGLSKEYFTPQEIEDYNDISPESPASKPKQLDNNTVDYGRNGRTYNKLREQIKAQTEKSRLGVNPVKLFDGIGNSAQMIVSQPRYKDKDLLVRRGIGSRDEINLLPLFLQNNLEDSIKINGGTSSIKDMIKFRIESVDGDNPTSSVWILFRALLTGITDSPNPSFNTITYAGRGEPFYIYQGFERIISFNLQVAAMSEAEMKPLWQKMNYLYSNVFPDYKNNLMRTPYVRLTLGDYVVRQPGIIKGLTYSIDDKSPWEIKDGDGELLFELPHVMNIQMSFALIHDFLPRKFSSEGENPAFVLTTQNEWIKEIPTTEILR